MTQTCLTCGTRGNFVYTPPGFQLFASHGGGQSEPGCWSVLNPHPGTPLPVTKAGIDVFINRYGNFGTPPGEGGVTPPGPSDPRRAVSDGAYVVTPSRPQLRNPDIVSTSAVTPETSALYLLSASHTLPEISCQVCGMVGKPYSPSSAYLL